MCGRPTGIAVKRSRCVFFRAKHIIAGNRHTGSPPTAGRSIGSPSGLRINWIAARRGCYNTRAGWRSPAHRNGQTSTAILRRQRLHERAQFSASSRSNRRSISTRSVTSSTSKADASADRSRMLLVARRPPRSRSRMTGRWRAKARRRKLSGPVFEVLVRIDTGNSRAKADRAGARLRPP